MGACKTRREAVAEAKKNLFADWFVAVRFIDGTWDYAAPGHPLSISDRAEQIMYLCSRSTDNWYIKYD